MWLVLCLRVAQFVPLPGFAHAPPGAGAQANVLNLLLPTDLGELTVSTAGLSVCHMGISPYITASIAMSFALAAVPELRQWRKDAGAEGTDIIAQWGRRLGLLCSLAQATWTAFSLRSAAAPILQAMPLPEYLACTVFPLAAGTSCLMWLAEEITRTGIGQGTSVAISLSIVGGYASALRSIVPALLSGSIAGYVPALACLAFLAQTALAVLVVEGVRKVPIAFFQLQGGAGAGGAGRRATALNDDHIPFRANPTGVQPVLFAVCLLEGTPVLLAALGAPAALLQSLAQLLSPQGLFYYVAYVLVVFAFSFLDVEDTPAEVAEYILKVGARVPGVRPGEATVAFLRDTQFQARAWGGLLLSLLSALSMAADKYMHAQFGKSIGFTSLLIITGTVLQMRRQIRAFAEKPKLKATLAQL